MEEIIMRMGLDGSGFQRGLSAVTGSIDGFKQKISDVGARLTAMLSIGALTKLASDAVQYASDITDAAAATRTTVEGYQALAAVARESGASMQQLDQALIKTTVSAEKAAEGEKEYAEAFAVLNINVEKFLKLPTEEKLEALGAAYNASGRSTEAYAALTDIIGTRSAPRLIEALERLGTEGFDAVSKSAQDAGLVLNEFDAIKLDRLADEFQNWKTRSLVFVGEVVSSFDRLFRFIGGDSRSKIYFEDVDPQRAAARVDAINQLIEEDFAAHQARMAELGSRRNPYYDESAAKQKIVNAVQEDEERIQARIVGILDTKRERESQIAAAKSTQLEQAARQAQLDESNAATVNALKMIEDGRALLRLKEMSDKDRLLALEGLHIEALERVKNMELLGEGTAKEKEAIAKRVIDLEKQIGDTKEKIATDEEKAGEARQKKQEDLLTLLEKQAELQAQIDARAFEQYGRSSGDIASGGGGSQNSTLGRLASEADRLGEVAQRQFDELSRAKARAAGGDQDAARELERLQTQFDTTESSRRKLEDKVSGAQGGPTGDPQLDQLIEIQKHTKKLADELESA